MSAYSKVYYFFATAPSGFPPPNINCASSEAARPIAVIFDSATRRGRRSRFSGGFIVGFGNALGNGRCVGRGSGRLGCGFFWRFAITTGTESSSSSLR